MEFQRCHLSWDKDCNHAIIPFHIHHEKSNRFKTSSCQDDSLRGGVGRWSGTTKIPDKILKIRKKSSRIWGEMWSQKDQDGK